MPGGPAYSIDSNGEIMLGQMYVQYVRLAAADVARRRHDRGNLGNYTGRSPRLADVLPALGVRYVRFRRCGAVPRQAGAGGMTIQFGVERAVPSAFDGVE